jgi:hypothetical protein
MPPALRLLHVIAEHQRWHAALALARARASGQKPSPDLSATGRRRDQASTDRAASARRRTADDAPWSTSRNFGTAPDGRLFWTYQGGIYLPSTLWTVLQKARPVAFTKAHAASPLAHKPYEFRHAEISGRLNAGRLRRWSRRGPGHTVEVLLRIYAHRLDGDDDQWLQRTEELLGWR